MEDLLAGTPAPEAPAAPEAPVTPPAPPVPDAADAADAKEWEDAANDLFPGLNNAKKEPAKDEPTKPTKDPKAPEAPQDQKPPIDPNETAEQKLERETKEAADAANEENEPPDTTARDTRLAARESAQEVAAYKSDVREKMFADIPTELKDADGDPIKSVDDVVKLMNPQTGAAFTPEEAALWLTSARQQFSENLAATEKQIEQIAEVNIDLKDQSDVILGNFGELLKAMPDVRDAVWAEFSKTLVKDPKTGIIIGAPVSLKNFYTTALKPYATLAESLEATEATRVADAAKATADAAAATAAAEAAKRQNRADRSDIYGGGKTDTMDEDEKEWAGAAEAVFGKLKK